MEKDLPELPEVETVRRGLVERLVGSRIDRVEIRQPNLRWPIPEEFAATVGGSGVKGFRRRGKYILCDLTNDRTMLIHLGMSGSIRTVRVGLSPGEPNRHDHVVWHIEDGSSVMFHDPRRFGMLDIIVTGEEHACRHLRELGPEPLGNAFSPAALGERLKGRKVAIKNALLDQKVVAGIGNIYACESLWTAGISPVLPCGKLDTSQLDLLVRAIRTVLREAIEAGGSTLRNYRAVGGEIGGFQDRFNVYDREACPCPRVECGTPVERIIQSARSTFYCPRCQDPPSG